MKPSSRTIIILSVLFLAIALVAIKNKQSQTSKAEQSPSQNAAPDSTENSSSASKSVKVNASVAPASGPRNPAAYLATAPMPNPSNLLEDLQKASTKPWNPSFDRMNGRLRTLAQGELEIPGRSNEEKAKSFIDTFAAKLTGVEPRDLTPLKVVESERVKVVYQQHAFGREVYAGTLSLVFENGLLTRIQNDAISPPEKAPEQKLSLIAAVNDYTKNPSNGRLVAQGRPSTVEINRSREDLAPTEIYYPAGSTLVSAARVHTIERDEKGALNEFLVILSLEDGRVLRKASLHIN